MMLSKRNPEWIFLFGYHTAEIKLPHTMDVFSQSWITVNFQVTAIVKSIYWSVSVNLASQELQFQDNIKE